jgi:predicted permease
MNAIRYAWRSLARTPGFSLIAVLSLGLGLGLSTTAFAVLDAVTHPHVAFSDPDALFIVRLWYPTSVGRPIEPTDLLRTIRNETRSFEAVLPLTTEQMWLETPSESRSIVVSRVAAQFSQMAGLETRLGRGFTPGDDEDVAVLSGELWQRLFGRRRSLESATVSLNDRIYSVIGVLPRGATLPNGARLWLPIPQSSRDLPLGLGLTPVVRLRHGVAKPQADAELRALAELLTRRLSTTERPIAFALEPIRQPGAQVRDIHVAIVGAALAVLVIACLNLAHLMLARGLAKRRELALRMALGASRTSVVSLMLTECAIVTAGGVALGAVVSSWGVDVLINRMPPEVSWVGLIQPQLSWRAFALSAFAATGSAVVFGLVPAIRVALELRLDEPLKDSASATTARSQQHYSPLVIAVVALALVLSVGGALLLRTARQLANQKFTFEARHLLTAYVGIVKRDSNQAWRRDQVIAAVSGIRGVRAAAYAKPVGVIQGAITAEMSGDHERMMTAASYLEVSWQYVRVHGLRMLAGREFEPGDPVVSTGVAVINDVVADRLYPHQSAVGRMIKLGAPASGASWVRVIGVMQSPKDLNRTDEEPVGPIVLVAGADEKLGWGQLLVRTGTGNPQTPLQIQHLLHRMRPLQSSPVESYTRELDGELASRRFLAKIFITMGGAGLSLAALGLYSVLSYSVTRRRREFGVRLALGAAPSRLFLMVVRESLVMLLAGIGLGAFVTFWASGYLDAALTTSVPVDVATLVACETILAAVGLGAALEPARRAIRSDPVEILRAT